MFTPAPSTEGVHGGVTTTLTAFSVYKLTPVRVEFKKIDNIYYLHNTYILKMLNRLSVRLNNEQHGEKGNLYCQRLNIINSEIYFYSHFKRGNFCAFSLIFQYIKHNSSPLL